jgi:neuroligin
LLFSFGRRNPNEHHRQDTVLVVSKERNRFRSITWDEYDPVHQKYLEIGKVSSNFLSKVPWNLITFLPSPGMKPKMKNHFRAHQLSIWLRLIPELHKAGMEDVIARHNLFKNHDDMNLYDGPVKPDSLSRLSFLEENFKRRNGNSSLDLALFSGEFSCPRDREIDYL